MWFILWLKLKNAGKMLLSSTLGEVGPNHLKKDT